jgi:hypothetical protein
MDRHDQDLLDKQMRRITPSPRGDGAMGLALVAVFLAGMTLGTFMAVYRTKPARFASNEAMAALSPSSHQLPIAR